MAFKCWGERFLTTDFSGASRVYQSVDIPNTSLIRAVRTWFVIFNDPQFTALQMRVYSDVNSTLGQLIATSSNSWTKDEVTEFDNGAREIYFEFNPAVSISGPTRLHFVPWITGYTGDENSHIAWMKSFPDPVNSTGLNVTAEKIATLPYKMAFVGGEL